MQNGKYKYEIHCHTDETSNCGRVPAKELVELYKSKGYDGIVITDHYSQMTFKGAHCLKAGKEYDKFLKGYRTAKKYESDDFTVLLGMEIRGFCSAIDFLVYGVSEEFVKNVGNLLFKYSRRFHKIAKKKGFLVIGAHPYRMFPIKPNKKAIDGVEILNGKESDKNNQKAKKWAEKHGFKIQTVGSDFHRTTHKKFCAILTEKPIKTNTDLLEILKTGNFETYIEIEETYG